MIELEYISPSNSIELNEAINIETTFLNYELLLHHIFLKDGFSYFFNGDKKFCVLYYCLTFRYITARQLSETGLFKNVTNEGLNMLLKRLYQNGYMTQDKAVINERAESVYTLTVKGASYCLSLLDNYMSKITNTKILDIYVQLKGAPLYYLVTRFSFKQSNNYTHILGIRSLNLYLLTNPYSHINYRYTLEVPIKQNGTVATLSERSEAKLKLRNNCIIADALLEYPVDGLLYRFFIEQDTGTQRAAVIQKKIRSYLNGVIEAVNHKELNSLVFSIGIPYSPKMYQTLDDVPCSSMAKDYISLAELIAALHSNFNLIDDALSMVKINEIIPPLGQFCKKYSSSNFYKNALNYLENINVSYPNITISGAYNLINQQKKIEDRSISKRKKTYLHARYTARRKAIYSIATEIEECKEAFLGGFSLYCSNAHDHSSVFPFLIPEIFNGRKLFETIVSLCIIKDAAVTSIDYNSAKGNKHIDGYILKNHYCFNSIFNLYVENISDDLGGYHRVAHYLNHPTWRHGTGVLLCIVSDSDIDLASNLYTNTVYTNYIQDHPGALCNKISETFSLQVLFIRYSELGQKFSFFTFDKNGNEITTAAIV